MRQWKEEGGGPRKYLVRLREEWIARSRGHLQGKKGKEEWYYRLTFAFRYICAESVSYLTV